MSNDFEKCMQIAEFAQRNQHDRRQYEFKIFISYMTLLALGIWKTDEIQKIDNACLILGIVVGLSYILYLIWNVRLAVANSNDEIRRNYYLAAAEDMLYRWAGIEQVPNDYRDKEKESRAAGKEADRIKTVPYGLKLFKGWGQFWRNWSIWFTTLLPFLLVVVLAFRLCCCYENIVL